METRSQHPTGKGFQPQQWHGSAGSFAYFGSSGYPADASQQHAHAAVSNYERSCVMKLAATSRPCRESKLDGHRPTVTLLWSALLRNNEGPNIKNKMKFIVLRSGKRVFLPHNKSDMVLRSGRGVRRPNRDDRVENIIDSVPLLPDAVTSSNTNDDDTVSEGGAFEREGDSGPPEPPEIPRLSTSSVPLLPDAVTSSSPNDDDTVSLEYYTTEETLRDATRSPICGMAWSRLSAGDQQRFAQQGRSPIKTEER